LLISPLSLGRFCWEIGDSISRTYAGLSGVIVMVPMVLGRMTTAQPEARALLLCFFLYSLPYWSFLAPPRAPPVLWSQG
jgi:hypothetical protein